MLENEIGRIADSLLWNIHTSAAENILSSLLNACLNESEEFRNSFIQRVTGSENSTVKTIRAMANTRFPPCISNGNIVHTDAMLWDCNQDLQWDRFEKRRSRSSAVREGQGLWDIYIEFKHSWIDIRDTRKYLKNVAALKKVSDSLFFVVISSLSDKAK